VAESQRGEPQGTLHGFEIPYVFGISCSPRGRQDNRCRQDPNGGGRTQWPRHDPAVHRVINFTNAGVVVGPDPLKTRLDLWQTVWERD